MACENEYETFLTADTAAVESFTAEFDAATAVNAALEAEQAAADALAVAQSATIEAEAAAIAATEAADDSAAAAQEAYLVYLECMRNGESEEIPDLPLFTTTKRVSMGDLFKKKHQRYRAN